MDPWRGKADSSAEINSGGVQWQVGGGGPETELCAPGAAGETAVAAGDRICHEGVLLAARERTTTAKMTAATPGDLEVEHPQDLLDGDLGTNGREVDSRHEFDTARDGSICFL